MTIPADLLKLKDIKAGDPLDVDVVPGGFIVRKAEATPRKRYTLAELMEGVEDESMATLSAETAWVQEGAPVGREAL